MTSTTVRHQEIAPPAELREAVRCLWHTSLRFGEPPASFEVVPDGYAEIIFYFGGPCSLAAADGGWQPLPSPFLMGLLDQPARLRAEHGQLEVIGIRCFPWTVFELLGLPAGPDEGRVRQHPLAGLQAPLAELVQAGQMVEALTLVAQYLQTHPPAPDPLLGKAGAALRAAHGTLPVGQVAAAAHATVRTLERRFKQAAGHTVKDVAALMRFEQVRNRLWWHPDTRLAGLAHELGYTDQAHLSREFRRYSGTTPAAFARAARQRGRPDFVAFVQA